MKSSICFILFAIANLSLAQNGVITAFSMKIAGEEIRKSQNKNIEANTLGGISQLLGFVIDSAAGDIIIIGVSDKREKPISLSDLSVALRGAFVIKKWPLVSIDRTPETDVNGLQKIRFEGCQPGNAFADDLLAADVLLKYLALGKTDASLWGVKSYFDLCAEKSTSEQYDLINSLFWFVAEGYSSLERQSNVFVIRSFQLGVRNQVLNPEFFTNSNKQVMPGDVFAKSLSTNMMDLSMYFPELKRLYALYSLVAVADGLSQTPSLPDVSYWLNDFKIENTPVQEYFPLVERKESIQGKSDTLLLVLNGGVAIKSLISKIRDSDIAGLKDLVLLSRPHARTLVWEIPVIGWQLPANPPIIDYPQIKPEFTAKIKNTPGTQITGYWNNATLTHPHVSKFAQIPSPIDNMPQFTFTNATFSRQIANIGGVLLSGSAEINSSASTDSDIMGRNFSLLANGTGARVSPVQYRRFVTALWAVYFGKEYPGISIDPIADGVDRHLVRYIGNVVNTDLGRVMREADYDMKKIAVGKKRLNIPGFQSIEEFMQKSGINYWGASRRFWFIPENMRFLQTDQALIFDSGRMTLKTEYVHQDKSFSAEPADLAFTEFFTKNYEQIAQIHPIYAELFEYAKLTALADYLKKKNIPLFWFLMANKDMVITESSPGTVMELTKTSKIFKNVVIKGGVILEDERPQYVYDRQAQEAISQAVQKQLEAGYSLAYAKQPATSITDAPDIPAQKKFSILPQHTEAAGFDAKGGRYQTDIAVKDENMPGIELVRYFNPSRKDEMGGFGKGWRLLLPYSLSLTDTSTVIYGDYRVKKRIALTNELTGETEILIFNDKFFSIGAYIPKDTLKSPIMALVPTTNNAFFLVDKLGNEFHFDPAWNLTDLILGENYHLVVSYNYDLVDDFEFKPYRILPIGEERKEVDGLHLPALLELINLTNGLSTAFLFDDTSSFLSYLPKDPTNSVFERLYFLTDGSLQLIDKKGNEIVFAEDGEFTGYFISENSRPAIASISQGEFLISFKYKLTEENDLVIASAQLTHDSKPGHIFFSKSYQYDQGRLVNTVNQ